MNLLEKMLGKLGVSYEELNDEERDTFKKWGTALAGRKLTDEDVKTFLDTEYHDAVVKLSSQKLNERDDIFLKMKLDFIIKTKEFLAIPEKEKAMVEQQIQTQL